MNSAPPLTEPPVVGSSVFSQGWSNWLALVYRCLAWKRSFIVTATVNFGNVAAQGQLSSAITPVPALGLVGVRSGDSVHVTPTTDVSGLIFSGVVTANDTVTLYAKNFTAGAIDPASQVFRIVVIQN